MFAIAARGPQGRKNMNIKSRIAPPNACLGARQRELQLKDSTLTTVQKEKLQQEVKQSKGQVGAVAASTSLDSTVALEALVQFNERKSQEKREKEQVLIYIIL